MSPDPQPRLPRPLAHASLAAMAAAALLSSSCATQPFGDQKGKPIFASFGQCMAANGVGAVPPHVRERNRLGDPRALAPQPSSSSVLVQDQEAAIAKRDNPLDRTPNMNGEGGVHARSRAAQDEAGAT